MISEFFPPKSMGGGELSAYSLAKELVKEKIEVHVLTSYFEGLKKQESLDGIKIFRFLKSGNPNNLQGNMDRLLNFEKSLLIEFQLLHVKEKYDIVHCMNTNSILAIKIKNKINRPFIMHVNGPTPFCPKGTLMYKDKEICNQNCTRKTHLDCYLHSKRIGKMDLNLFSKLNPIFFILGRQKYENYQKLIPSFDYFMPISTYMAKRLYNLNINKNKVNVIYNILDLDGFKKLKQPKNKIKKILYLGSYSGPKGAQILVDALIDVEEKYDANFYGNGILKNKLIKKSNKYNLRLKINNAVKYDEIPNIISKHDIIVIPSLVGEAFGRVALEALAAKKTVIASSIGGITDVIKHKKTGYLFEPGNSKELAENIDFAIQNNNLDLSNVNLSKFERNNIIKKVIKIYDDLWSNYKNL